MMEGITILSTNTEVVTEIHWEWSTLPFIMFCGLILITFLIIRNIRKNDWWNVSLSIEIICWTLLAIFLYPVGLKERQVDEYNIYKVTIEDTVLMNKFNERYEILSQEDKIYTIIEKRLTE